MDNTIMLQGSFVSNGVSEFIPLISGVSYIQVTNYTRALATIGAVPNVIVEAKWRAGMAAGEGITYWKTGLAANATNLTQVTLTNCFTLFDSSTQTLVGPALAVNAISGAAIPVVTTAVNHNLPNRSIVKLISIIGGLQVSGMDFTIGNVAAATFDLSYMPQMAAATTGLYRVVSNFLNPYWYPSSRYITAITRGVTTLVRMSVQHNYIVGQKIRLIVPAEFGTVELNGLQGTIIAVNNGVTPADNTITLDIDSSTFTAFTFPVTLVAAAGITYAQVVPVGENTAAALFLGTDILSGAMINLGTKGIILGSNVVGTAGDIIYWEAFRSFTYC